MRESWPLLSSKTLTEQVYGVLRDRVISGEWEAGHFIREQEISDKLGVSRTPVREALGRLSSEGFLERIPHRGFRLPEQSPTDLLDLYPILTTLEVLAARQSLPRLDEEALAELRAINREYQAACERAEVQAGVELNNSYHNMLSARCGNDRLCAMLDELRREVGRLEMWAFSNLDQWEVSAREHDEILDAVAAGDIERALVTLERNRLMTYTDFRSHIDDGQVDQRDGAGEEAISAAPMRAAVATEES